MYDSKIAFWIATPILDNLYLMKKKAVYILYLSVVHIIDTFLDQSKQKQKNYRKTALKNKYVTSIPKKTNLAS